MTIRNNHIRVTAPSGPDSLVSSIFHLAALIAVLNFASAQAAIVTIGNGQPMLGAFDQYQLSNLGEPSGIGATEDQYKLQPSYPGQGQSFTVPSGYGDMKLTAFSEYIGDGDLNGAWLRGSLRASPNGGFAILWDWAQASGTNGAGWITFSFNAAPTLTAGATYCMDIQNGDTSGWGNLTYGNNAGYNGGQAYISSGTGTTLAFDRTFVVSLAPVSTNTTTTLASSLTPSAYGRSVTFTATIAPAFGVTVPTGTVQFSVDGSALGSPVRVSPSSTPNGAASVSTTTLTVAGSPHTVTAVFAATGGFNGSSGTLSGGQTVIAGPAASLVLTSGQNQFGALGAPLAAPFVVTVTDINGQPVAGANVTFAVTTPPSGATGQSLSVTTALTGANGQASSTLTLGSKAGTYGVATTANGLIGSPVSFTATATASSAPTVTVSFASPTGKLVSPLTFGINGWAAVSATVANNSAYRNNLVSMNAGMLRYHNWEMITAGANHTWVNSSQDWDTNKIRAALGTPFASNPTRMVNIPWSKNAWKDGAGKLLSSKYAAFASWCAQLVQIVNKDNNYNVKYWEIINEQDDLYAANCDELGRIYNQCVDAMKAVDPTIICGGPAFIRTSDPTRLNAFFSTARDRLEFISFHSYLTGSAQSAQWIYDHADVTWNTRAIDAAWKAVSSRTVEYHHNEYNISWNPPDSSMNNDVGMIHDAIALVAFASCPGFTSASAWNDADGWYGKMDGSYNARPALWVFKAFNDNLRDLSVVSSSSSDASKVVPFAGLKNGICKVVAINRSQTNLSGVNFVFNGISAGSSAPVDVTICTQAGGITTQQTTVGALQSGVNLGSQTVVVYSFNLAPPTLAISPDASHKVVLSWSGAGFHLQSAGTVTGSYTNEPGGASSPVTNATTGSQKFYRLSN